MMSEIQEGIALIIGIGVFASMGIFVLILKFEAWWYKTQERKRQLATWR